MKIQIGIEHILIITGVIPINTT